MWHLTIVPLLHVSWLENNVRAINDDGGGCFLLLESPTTSDKERFIT
jgi:hypothetical protein